MWQISNMFNASVGSTLSSLEISRYITPPIRWITPKEEQQITTVPTGKLIIWNLYSV